MYSSSSRVNTLPVGLLGVLRMMALVRGVKARRSSSGSNVPVGRLQRDIARFRSAQLRIGAVVFVKRLEQHHLVARVEHRHHGGDHAFGGAAAHRDLAFGIVLHPIGARVLGGDGIAKRLGAPGDGVLVDVGGDGLGRGLLQCFGGGEVGEALAPG